MAREDQWPAGHRGKAQISTIGDAEIVVGEVGNNVCFTIVGIAGGIRARVFATKEATGILGDKLSRLYGEQGGSLSAAGRYDVIEGGSRVCAADVPRSEASEVARLESLVNPGALYRVVPTWADGAGEQRPAEVWRGGVLVSTLAPLGRYALRYEHG